jgi:hypothetical protein
MRPRSWHAPTWASGAGLAVVLAGIIALSWAVTRSPKVAFLDSEGPGTWIVYPSPSSTFGRPPVTLDASFKREFRLGSAGGPTTMRLRAFRAARVSVNGTLALEQLDRDSWKQERRAEIGHLLRVGDNRIEVVVSNDMGPPALWLALDSPWVSIRSDRDWDVSWAGAAWMKAAPASDGMRGRRFDEGHHGRSVHDVIAANGVSVLGIAAAAAALVLAASWVRRRAVWASQLAASRWPLRIAWLMIAVAWCALFVNNSGHLPLATGFDVSGHLEYVRYVSTRHAIPLASEGWQMYQPPLYYAMMAAALSTVGASVGGPGAEVTFRAMGLVLGLLQLALLASSLRLVFPANPRRQLLGFVVASFLPATLCLYQYPTNEILALTLSTATIWATLRIVTDRDVGAWSYGFVGLLLGMALLAKVSAILLVPALMPVLAWHAYARRSGLRGVLARLGSLIAATLLACGWHYGRVWIQLGSPFVTNREVFPHWQDPGYRTASEYLRFGRVFETPLFAGFSGFWDGLYSTLWGDGLASGYAEAWPLPWSYDLVTVAYLLAIIPAAAILIGAVVALRSWVRSPGPVIALLVGLALAGATALLQWSLVTPFFSTKTFYALGPLLLPIAAFAAMGMDGLATRVRPLVPVVLAASLTWAAFSYAAYFIAGDSPGAMAAVGARWLAKGETDRGSGLLRRAISLDPSCWDARLTLARAMLARRPSSPELVDLLRPDEALPDTAARHAMLAQLAMREADLSRARVEASRAVSLDPDDPRTRGWLASLSESFGDINEAIAQWRQVLRIDPFDRRAHEALARDYERLGMTEPAAAHRAYASRMAPR